MDSETKSGPSSQRKRKLSTENQEDYSNKKQATDLRQASKVSKCSKPVKSHTLRTHPPDPATVDEPTPKKEKFETDLSHPTYPPDSAKADEPTPKINQFETGDADDDDSSLFLDATLSSNWVDNKLIKTSLLDTTILHLELERDRAARMASKHQAKIIHACRILAEERRAQAEWREAQRSAEHLLATLKSTLQS